MVPIHEDYKTYQPPPWVRSTVERLLLSLDGKYTAALGAVVLTDAANIGRGKTRRVHGRKHHRNECLGFYHARSKGEPASILLVVDNIVAARLRVFQKIQFFRDIALGKTLYHEIGHHLDATVGSAHRGGEAAAEGWRKQLMNVHALKRYGYLRRFRVVLRPLLWCLSKFLGTRTGRTRRASGM